MVSHDVPWIGFMYVAGYIDLDVCTVRLFLSLSRLRLVKMLVYLNADLLGSVRLIP